MDDSDKDQTPGHQNPVNLDNPAAGQATVEIGGVQYPIVDGQPRTGSRTSAGVVPASMLVKIRTQVSRISTLKRTAELIASESATATAEMVAQWDREIEATYKAFGEEHRVLENSCTVALMAHEYFQRDALGAASDQYSLAMSKLTKIKERLGPQQTTGQAQGAESIRRRFPEIKLPTFSGDYADWAGFMQLFTSYVINEPRLSDLEKLHYLRISLTGSPAKLVEGFPLAEESFKLAWDTLLQRYENKKFVLAQHFDALYRLNPAKPNNASSLSDLVAEHQRLRKSIMRMGTTEEILDAFFVHGLLGLVDKHSRETWETNNAQDNALPKCEPLEEFLISRVRALELAGGPRPIPSRSSEQAHKVSNKSARAHTVQQSQQSQPQKGQRSQQHQTQQESTTSNQSKSTTEGNAQSDRPACMYCQGDHYISSCYKFLQMSAELRYKYVDTKPLCYNCLGRHPYKQCRNPKRCTECGGLHHTLLHGATKTKGSGKAPAQQTSSLSK